MALQLVQQELADAAMFTCDGEVVIPGEVLFNKPVLVERGSYRPITKTTLDILDRAREQFLREPEMKGEEPVILMEMTLHSVLDDANLAHKDFLDRVDLLRTLGKTVLISNFGRYYRLVQYLSRYTQKMQGIALGIPSLRGILTRNFTPTYPAVCSNRWDGCSRAAQNFTFTPTVNPPPASRQPRDGFRRKRRVVSPRSEWRDCHRRKPRSRHALATSLRAPA